MSWSGDGQHYEFDPDHSLFTSLCVIREDGPEIKSWPPRKNVVNIGKKIQRIDMLDILLGVPDATFLLFDYHITQPICHSYSYPTLESCQNQADGV